MWCFVFKTCFNIAAGIWLSKLFYTWPAFLLKKIINKIKLWALSAWNLPQWYEQMLKPASTYLLHGTWRTMYYALLHCMLLYAYTCCTVLHHTLSYIKCYRVYQSLLVSNLFKPLKKSSNRSQMLWLSLRIFLGRNSVKYAQSFHNVTLVSVTVQSAFFQHVVNESRCKWYRIYWSASFAKRLTRSTCL